MKNRRVVLIFVMMMVCFFVLAGFSYAKDLPKVRWTVQTTWAKGMLIHDEVEVFAKRVSDMTGGNFVIKVLPAGAIVGAMENMEATSKGTLDGWHSWTGYWQGKHP